MDSLLTVLLCLACPQVKTKNRPSWLKLRFVTIRQCTWDQGESGCKLCKVKVQDVRQVSLFEDGQLHIFNAFQPRFARTKSLLAAAISAENSIFGKSLRKAQITALLWTCKNRNQFSLSALQAILIHHNYQQKGKMLVLDLLRIRQKNQPNPNFIIIHR